MIEHINIRPQEYLKLLHVLCHLARNSGISILQARRIIQQAIDEAWDQAWTPGNLQAQWNWQTLFPADRAPSTAEFIVVIAREMEAGNDPPFLLG